MKQYRNLIVPALAVPVLVAFATPAAELKFSPKEGATVSMTLEQTSEMSLENMSILQNGQDMSAMIGDMEMSMNQTQTVTIVDEYVALDGSRPTNLKRTFEALSGNSSTSMSNPMTGDMDADVESASELEGATVVFTWDEGNGEYDVAFEDGEGDDALLEGLEADITLRGFLPSGEVAEGDSWDVDPAAMRALLAPGGQLKLEPEDSPEQDMMGPGANPSPDEFLREIEGSITATYKGSRDLDGISVAVIALEFDVTAAADMTDWMADALEEADLGQEGMEMNVDAFDLEFAYSGEGELHWNPQANVAHGLAISGEMELLIDQIMNMTIPQAGEVMIEQTMELAGTQEVKLTAGR